MFTDFRQKTLFANWLPWQQGNVYFWFIKLKILLIPSFEKLPSFKVLACSVMEFWAIYWAWGGKHPPPSAYRVNKKKTFKLKLKSTRNNDWACSQTRNLLSAMLFEIWLFWEANYIFFSSRSHRFKKYVICLFTVSLKFFRTLRNGLFSLAHKSKNVYNLSDIWIRDDDVRTYFTGPHSYGKIFHFAGSGHRRILELWGGSLLSRDP